MTHLTEAEWLACDDFRHLFRGAAALISSRHRLKWWLASCRAVWDRLTDGQKAALEAAEAGMDTRPYPGIHQISPGVLEAIRWVWLDRGRAAHYAGLLHDVVGNPYRRVAFDPSWRTDAVVSLARGAYDLRDFTPLPVLADALEDAGCADAGILSHCRDTGPHVRGCWVVDLVLGKG